MTNEEAMAYFIKCNENLISVAKDENAYNFEKQQIETICSRRAFEANKLAIKTLEQINKIADIVDGTIDHFEYDDAMDMLYEIKEVIK